jgi:hypothetical protein
MSDDLLPHSNVVIELHLCLYMSYGMDVDDNYLYQTYDVKHFNMAITWLKVIKASWCRLMNLYHLKPLRVSDSDCLVMLCQSC